MGNTAKSNKDKLNSNFIYSKSSWFSSYNIVRWSFASANPLFVSYGYI